MGDVLGLCWTVDEVYLLTNWIRWRSNCDLEYRQGRKGSDKFFVGRLSKFSRYLVGDWVWFIYPKLAGGKSTRFVVY